MADTYPTLPQYDDAAAEALLAGRQPSFIENLTANVQEGFWGSGFGQLGALGREVQGERADPTPMSREEWEASGYARLLGPAWDERMTRGRAAAQAATYDENQTRRTIMQQRDGGLGESVLGFGAQMLGSALSPESFIPIAGPATAALRGARLARAADALAAPTILGGAARGAVEGVLGNALIAPAVYAGQERYGEDVTWGRVVGDLAAGAVIGGAFGGVAGALARYADRQASAELLDAAAADVAAGRQVELPPRAMAATVEDAAVRSAPDGAERFIDFEAPPGARLQDLPTRADGSPLSRDELAERFDTEQLDGLRRHFQLGREAEPFNQGAAVEGARVPASTLTGYVAEIAKPTGGKSPLPRFLFALGRVPGMVAERLGALIPGFREMADTGDLTIPSTVVDKLYRQNAREADALMAALPDVLQNGRALRDHQHADRLMLAHPFTKSTGDATNQVVVVEVARRQDGLEIVSIHMSPDRTLKKAVEATENAGGGGTAPPHTAGPMEAPSAADFPIVAAREPGNIATPEGRAKSNYMDDVHAWYLDALEAQRRIQRMAEAPPERLPEPKEAEAEPVQDPAMAQVETMRAEGRLTAADEAILRAGDEQAAELQGIAKGLTEAGECALRNMT